MPVESASDRAVFFNADEFGVSAVYTPPVGAAVACTVLFGTADVELGSFTGRPTIAGKTIAVSADQVAAPVKAGTFTIAAVVYTIAGDPTTADPDRMIWTCPVR